MREDIGKKNRQNKNKKKQLLKKSKNEWMLTVRYNVQAVINENDNSS